MFINICDIKLNYEVVGEGQDIILLHGWGQNIQMMKPLQDYLSKWFRVWNIDLPGSPAGKSSFPTYAWDIYDYTVLISEFIDEMNIKDPIFIGHSFGGRISIIYGAKNKNIKKIVLLSSAGIRHSRNIKYYAKVISYKLMKNLLSLSVFHNYRKKLYEKFGSEDYKSCNTLMKEVFKNIVNEDLRYLMPNIKASTLLIWGENDEATPLKDGKLIENLVPNSALIVFKNAGHYAYLEQFEKLKRVLYSFLVKE